MKHKTKSFNYQGVFCEVSNFYYTLHLAAPVLLVLIITMYKAVCSNLAPLP